MRKAERDVGGQNSAVDPYDFFFFLGTFAPFLRALERPMAMACLRLLALPPLPPLPLFCLPRFCLWTAFLTSSPAFFPYLAIARLPGVRIRVRPKCCKRCAGGTPRRASPA